MTTCIRKSDFTILPSGYGHWKVTYQSPVTKKEWTSIISKSMLIDAVKNSDNPTIEKLNTLKLLVKQG